jgi:hypothetical protein
MAGRTTILITHDAQVAAHPDQVITIMGDPAIDVLEGITAQLEPVPALSNRLYRPAAPTCAGESG